MKNYFSILLLLLLFLGACEQKSAPIEEPTRTFGVTAKNGMVSSAHPLASQVGVEVLKQGGNAYDAAIAVQFALAVVYPAAGNIGGGGFMVYRKNDGETGALDFREKAPKAAHRDMYLDENGDVIPRLSLEGHLASGVPGSVDAMFQIHEKMGSLPMEKLIQPAIDLATNGYELTEKGAFNLNRPQELFLKFNLDTPSVVNGAEWKKGDLIKYTDLGKTLTRIRDNGREGFYGGETADLIIKEMERGGGIITKEDLAEYSAKWRDPVSIDYKDYKVITMSPPSSGIALLQLLEGTEKHDIKSWGHNSTKTIHLMVELERRVYADRASHLGDADFYDVPQKMLLDAKYLENRFADISLDKKTDSQDIKEGEVNTIESFETTHFSIVDKDGNAVSITTTLNGFFGCKVMVQGAGFFLNNEMDDFSIKPGVPNMFGLVGGEANAILPEKRMLSSMCPTILEKNGQLFMVVGTPGGSTIITSIYQTILNVIEHGMTMQEAVEAKKFHSQWLPDIVVVEDGALDMQTQNELTTLGHQLDINPKRTLGRMSCILMQEDGTMEGGADGGRGDNNTTGY